MIGLVQNNQNKESPKNQNEMTKFDTFLTGGIFWHAEVWKIADVLKQRNKCVNKYFDGFSPDCKSIIKQQNLYD